MTGVHRHEEKKCGVTPENTSGGEGETASPEWLTTMKVCSRAFFFFLACCLHMRHVPWGRGGLRGAPQHRQHRGQHRALGLSQTSGTSRGCSDKRFHHREVGRRFAIDFCCRPAFCLTITVSHFLVRGRVLRCTGSLPLDMFVLF